MLFYKGKNTAGSFETEYPRYKMGGTWECGWEKKKAEDLVSRISAVPGIDNHPSEHALRGQEKTSDTAL